MAKAVRVVGTTAAGALCAVLSLWSPAARAQSVLASQAASTVANLEKVAGMPIAVLERTGDDLNQFWYRSMQILCAKTGDNWCSGDVQVLYDISNPLGWSQVLGYQPGQSSSGVGAALATYPGSDTVATGVQKKVCVILPPRQGVSEGYVASALGNGATYDWRDLPTSDEAEAFLYLFHAANCAKGDADDAFATKRADAFAALALTLIEGASSFVPGSDVTPARKFSFFRNRESTRWSVNVGERMLLDLWKNEAANKLRAAGCTVNVVSSTNLQTDAIQRLGALPPGANCLPSRYGPPQGTVSDESLWLFTSGSYYGRSGATVGLPPEPYTPFKSFGSVSDGIDYAWTTAASIATQR